MTDATPADPSAAAATWELTESLNLWDRNPRDNAAAVAEVVRSIDTFGFGSPIVANLRDRTVIAGNTRLLAARKIGMAYVPVRWLDLDPAQAAALALADNRLGEIATWDDAKLTELLGELRATDEALLAATGFSDDELARLLADGSTPPPDNNQYTRKVNIPIYECRGPKPALADLLDDTKARELAARVDAAQVPDEIKAFLRAAADRHTRFNFAAIAEFYAHSDAAVQALFEESALVIVDFQRAIELGFVKLHDELFSVVESEDEHA